jgi:hypothetical protein
MEARRLAVLMVCAVPAGIAIVLALEVCTSLDRYGATLPQAVNAAGHSIVMPHGIRNSAAWAALLMLGAVVRQLLADRRARQSIACR